MKIEKIEITNLSNELELNAIGQAMFKIANKINELVEAVNNLESKQGVNNLH